MVISKSIALPPGRGYAAAAIADSLAEQYLSLGSLTLRTPNQIKNVLDGVAAAVLFPVFGWVYQALSAQGCLTAYEVLNEQMLVGLDGTEYLALPA